MLVKPFEREVYALDQRINDRGVKVDVEFVQAAIHIATAQTEKLMARARELTGLTNPRSLTQLRKWLTEELDEGTVPEALDKKAVAAMLKITDDDVVSEVLQIRQQLGKSSVSKYKAMLRSVCIDGRVRGLFMYYGASRSGRHSSKIVQLQNLPQNKLSDLDLARRVTKTGDLDNLSLLYGNVFDVLSQLIRTAFVPEADVFSVADFSAIEARVAAWFCGEQWRMDVFNTHGKIYEASASAMFNEPFENFLEYERRGKKHPLRQKGKIAELSCIAAGQLVLTDKGLVPIQEVTTSQKVWDGVEFVSHDGVICKGLKDVITYSGLTATPDHVVFTQSGQTDFAAAARSGSRLVQSGAGGQAVRVCESYQPGEALQRRLDRPVRRGAVRSVRQGGLVLLTQLADRGVIWVQELFSRRQVRPKVASGSRPVDGQPLSKNKRRRLSQLRRAWGAVLVQLGQRGLSIHHAQPWFAPAFAAGSGGQQRALRAGQSSLRQSQDEQLQQANKQDDRGARRVGENAQPSGVQHNQARFSQGCNGAGHYQASTERSRGEAEELARHTSATGRAWVYDIVNAGPRNRFTVSDVLVHNCQYGSGTAGLIRMGALDMGLTEPELQPIIDGWRKANPEMVSTWYGLERAAKTAIKTKKPQTYKYVEFMYSNGRLLLVMPNRNRALTYHGARLDDEGQITYWGVDSLTKKWCEQRTWGSKLLENLAQGISRDYLMQALVAMKHLPIVMHVHDEVIVEGDHLESMLEIMGRDLSWAPGLLMRADGYTTPYYRKDD